MDPRPPRSRHLRLAKAGRSRVPRSEPLVAREASTHTSAARYARRRRAPVISVHDVSKTYNIGEIAVHARRTLIVAQLNARAFPERVDFVTSPGQRCAGRTRRELGMPGAGPVKVITDKAILEADEATGEMALAALYPGVSADDVQGGVGWPLARRAPLAAVAPPNGTELRLLREVLDPRKLYLKG